MLNDVMVHTEYGDTAQIDHIVIGETGIFVIEMKDYEDWIYESEKASIVHINYNIPSKM